jgi:hypothetical protein
MALLNKISKSLLLSLFLFVMIFSSGCGSSKKNPYYEKRMKASQTHTTPLGRNKYYYSKDYQKKLTKSYKRK